MEALPKSTTGEEHSYKVISFHLECPVCHGDFDTEDLLLLHWERQHNVETDVRIFVEDCLIREPEGGVVGIYKFRSLF